MGPRQKNKDMCVSNTVAVLFLRMWCRIFNLRQFDYVFSSSEFLYFTFVYNDYEVNNKKHTLVELKSNSHPFSKRKTSTMDDSFLLSITVYIIPLYVNLFLFVRFGTLQVQIKNN